MRALIVTTYNDRSEVALYKGLADAGIGVEIICSPGAREIESLRRHGLPVDEMNIRHRLDLGAAVRLRRRIRAERYDVIYAVRNSTLSVSLLAAIGIPTAVVGYRGTVGHISRLDPACWLTYLNPRVTRIVCVSEAVRKYLLGFGLPPGRLVTVYKGHDPEWYVQERRADLAAFGIPAGSFVVCFTGNIRPVKGVDALLDAFLLIPPASNARLLLVGENRDHRVRRMLDMAGVKERCIWLGYRRDASAIAGAAHAFVMPSVEREGLSRAVIEAMAQGVPPIVTNVGGMPELVEHNVSGIVIPPRDPEAIASAIIALEKDPALRERLGREAARRIAGLFHIRRTIASMMALFQDAANEVICRRS